MAIAAVIAEIIASVLPLLQQDEPLPVQQRTRTTSLTDNQIRLLAEDALIKMKDKFPESLKNEINMEYNYGRDGQIMSIRYYSDSEIVQYLEEGTGIYNPKHAGKGPGGRIVAYQQHRISKGSKEGGRYTFGFRSVLHFKDAKLASKLGFPDENIYLKSVKGIKGKFIVTKDTKKLERFIQRN